MSVGRIIETPDCVAEGAEWLAAHEPRFAEALELTGTPPLRRKKDGFETLLSAIVSQQISTEAAAAIMQRVRDLLPDMEAEGLWRQSGVLRVLPLAGSLPVVAARRELDDGDVAGQRVLQLPEIGHGQLMPVTFR